LPEKTSGLIFRVSLKDKRAHRRTGGSNGRRELGSEVTWVWTSLGLRSLGSGLATALALGSVA
jgi:hypothetical protein